MTSDRQQCFLLLFFLRNCVLSLSYVDVCECCYFTFTLVFFLFVMMSSSHSLLCLTSCTLLLTFVPVFFSSLFIIYTTLCEKQQYFLNIHCKSIKYSNVMELMSERIGFRNDSECMSVCKIA